MALGDILMKRDGAGKSESRGTHCRFTFVKILAIYLALVILACLPLLPLIAMAILPKLIGETITSFLTWLFWVVALIAYSIWLLLTGEWGQFVILLQELIGWLRSFDLP
jgi:hypothetical protein